MPMEVTFRMDVAKHSIGMRPSTIMLILEGSDQSSLSKRFPPRKFPEWSIRSWMDSRLNVTFVRARFRYVCVSLFVLSFLMPELWPPPRLFWSFFRVLWLCASIVQPSIVAFAVRISIPEDMSYVFTWTIAIDRCLSVRMDESAHFFIIIVSHTHINLTYAHTVRKRQSFAFPSFLRVGRAE